MADNVEILVQKGTALLYLKRFKEACEIFGQALALEPDNVTSIYSLIYSYVKIGDFEAAKHLINLLYQYAPNDAETYSITAFFYVMGDRYKKAKKSILQAIAINPQDSTYFGILATIYQHFNQWDLAYQTAHTGLLINPTEYSCLEVKVLSCFHLSFYGEMIDLIHLILKMKPESSSAHAVVGWARLLNEDFEEAKIHFYESLRADPMNESAKRGLIQLIKQKNRLYLLALDLKNKINSINGNQIMLWAMTFALTYILFIWVYIPISELFKNTTYIFFGTIIFFMLLKIFYINFHKFIIETVTDILLLSTKERSEILTKSEKTKAFLSLFLLIICITILSYFTYAKL